MSKFPGRREVPTSEVSFSDEQKNQLKYSDFKAYKIFFKENYSFKTTMLNSFEIYDKHPSVHRRSS